MLRINYFTEYEEEEEKDQETSKGEDIRQDPTREKEEMNQTISSKALARITTPQTQDRRTYHEEKGERSERSHRASTTSSPTFKG